MSYRCIQIINCICTMIHNIYHSALYNIYNIFQHILYYIGAVGFEPTHGGFKDRCLTSLAMPQLYMLVFFIIYRACNSVGQSVRLISAKSAVQACSGSYVFSGKRGSNPQSTPWQGVALPLSYSHKVIIDWIIIYYYTLYYHP